MSEAKVRWAVKFQCADWDGPSWLQPNGGYIRGKTTRRLFEQRREAMLAAAAWTDVYCARLVKVTLRPKPRVPEKSLGQVAMSGYNMNPLCSHSTRMDNAAAAVRAAVLKEMGR